MSLNMSDSSSTTPLPLLFLFSISKFPFYSFSSFRGDALWTFPLFGLSEREMDVCAYWTVKGHSSGDTLIQPNIHEYLGDGNEGVLHCCMRMEGAPRRRRMRMKKRARTGRRGVAGVCVCVSQVWRRRGVCPHVWGDLVKRHFCLITRFHSLACSLPRARCDELDLLVALLNHTVQLHTHLSFLRAQQYIIQMGRLHSGALTRSFKWHPVLLMLSPLISLTDLNIHTSKTPFCDLKDGCIGRYPSFYLFFML